jgi:hypothetical protein
MDVEQRLHLAAVPLKEAVANFDGESFSARLYASLGISSAEVGAAVAEDGGEADLSDSGPGRVMVGPRAGGQNGANPN